MNEHHLVFLQTLKIFF